MLTQALVRVSSFCCVEYFFASPSMCTLPLPRERSTVYCSFCFCVQYSSFLDIVEDVPAHWPGYLCHSTDTPPPDIIWKLHTRPTPRTPTVETGRGQRLEFSEHQRASVSQHPLPATAPPTPSCKILSPNGHGCSQAWRQPKESQTLFGHDWRRIHSL